MASKHKKKYSTSLVTMRYHLTFTKISKIKMTITSIGEEMENWNSHTLLVGIQNGAATFKIAYQLLKF